MSEWEMVIGLETHVELSTKTKIFCSCENVYGAPPNSRVCPVCMGLPGALPALNESAVIYAAKAGLALHCHVRERSRFDRKNYFYPDLPKGYQITQFYSPLCENGYLDILAHSGPKRVRIERVHMEEDAGKLKREGESVLIDMNRCGVPLIEIVSAPDINSAAEAACYLRKLRETLVYAGVSHCRMNEGGLRCDVNLSVRRPGERMGTRTEMKNLNSVKSVRRAIEAEFKRQTGILESGGTIELRTLRFDQITGRLYPTRRKESSVDYRYFPDPDIPEVVISTAELRRLKDELPLSPEARKSAYMLKYGLSEYAAERLTAQKWLADYFDIAARTCESPDALCGLLLSEAQRLLSGSESIPVSPENMARLADMAEKGHVNSSTAKSILAVMFERDTPPDEYAREHELTLVTGESALHAARSALSQNPDMVCAYLRGKTNVKKALMGKAMALANGRADPKELARLIDELLCQLPQ